MLKKALTGLGLLVTTAAVASTPLEDYARRAIQSLPVHHEDRDYVDKAEQLEAIAIAVAERSKTPPAGISPRKWAALLLTVGFHESGYSERIQRGDCKPHECDGGRARGDWQTHPNDFNRADWEQANGNIEIQAKLADEGLRRGYWTCSRSGAPFPQGAINGFAGRRCSSTWKGLDERVLTFNRLVSK